ncbi:MAG TPA: hypothetical protein PKH93_00205 [Chitinophagales bacterium]|jgi:hypothetical protein|nr:hypothetical protein [Chitinophagales bacterium]
MKRLIFLLSIWGQIAYAQQTKPSTSAYTIVNTLHIRFASEIQAIDIWTTDSLTFSGTLTNFTRKFKPDKLGQKPKSAPSKEFYSQISQLDSNTAQKVYQLFKEKAIFDLPPQNSIAGWRSGLDGVTYQIEYAYSNYYFSEIYWTPQIFVHTIEEAKRLSELIQELEKLLNLQNSFENFIDLLPKGYYTLEGIIKLEKKQATKNKRHAKIGKK